MKTAIAIILVWLFILTIIVSYILKKNRLYKDALGNETA